MEDDPHRMRGRPPNELERLAIVERQDFNAAEAGAARAELARLRREHAETLANKQIEAADRQLAAAQSVRWATRMAAIAAALSAAGAIAQVGLAVASLLMTEGI